MDISVLGFVDLTVIVLTLLVSMIIGVFYHFVDGKQKTLQEYLLANKKGRVWSVSLSISATYVTGAHLLAAPSEGYSFGFSYLPANLGKMIFVIMTAFLYFPVFYKMQLISPFQYLEERFNYPVRALASFGSIATSIVFTGIMLYIPALAIQSITNFSVNWSIIILSVICGTYSTVGGIKGVILTDVFQFLLLNLTLFFILFKSTIDQGGILSVIETANERNRSDFSTSFDLTIRHTVWSTSIGGGIGYLSLTVVSETLVQRYMTLKTKKQAMQSILLSSFLNTVIATVSIYAGLAIFAKYKDCDPVKEGRIKKYDEIVPIYIYDSLSNIPGFLGLFISGIMAASLSTVSSNINSLSAMIVEDFIKPIYRFYYKSEFPDKRIIIYAKLASLFSGILSIIVAFSVSNITSLLQFQLIAKYLFTAPLLGVFTLGMFVPFGNAKGALSGFIVGCIFILWIAGGGPKPPLQRLPMSIEKCDITTYNSSILSLDQATRINNYKSTPNPVDEDEYFYLYRISYMWYTLFGFLVAFIIGAVVSLVTDSDKEINPDLFAYPISNYVNRTIVRVKTINNGYRDKNNGATKLLKLQETNQKLTINVTTKLISGSN